MTVPMAIRRFWLIVKSQFHIAVKRMKEDWKYQQLIRSLRSYVPKYWGRTEDEHTVIRRMVMADPKRCNHLKGGLYRPALSLRDFNVSLHTYIDGTQRIRCNGCGTKWFKGDADWDRALKMTEYSTNRQSSSEQVFYSVKYTNGKEEFLTPEKAAEKFPDRDLTNVKFILSSQSEYIKK
jgi:hypothetical protein